MSAPPQPQPARAQLTDGDDDFFVRREQAEPAQQEHYPTHPDIPEQIARRLRPLLPRLVNLRSGDRFRVRQLRILYHHAAHQRDEQHTEHAAHHHQDGGFPVGVSNAERGPRVRNEKGGKGEHGARRD